MCPPATSSPLKSRTMSGSSICEGAGGVVSVQVKPASVVQLGEQPSPAIVLPSSHSSVPPGRMTPSPQTATQVPPEQLGSFVQLAVQPSKGMRLPSSHCSVPSTVPLPQVVGAHGEPGVSQ